MNSLDTDVLVYVVSALAGDSEKAAKRLLASASNAGWLILAQVYDEFLALIVAVCCEVTFRSSPEQTKRYRLALQPLKQLQP